MSNKPGLNLADLAPASEDVPIGSDFMTVYGISARDGLRIIQRFPKILSMMGGEGFNLNTFLLVAPGAVSAIIAASVGKLDDEQSEENAGRLALETQFDILEAIGRLTFTSGFAPFAKRIMALAANAANSAPSTKAQVTKSPPASKPSLPEDTLPL
jgi:hypothetical protein